MDPHSPRAAVLLPGLGRRTGRISAIAEPQHRGDALGEKPAGHATDESTPGLKSGSVRDEIATQFVGIRRGFGMAQRVRFVREPEHDDPERETLSIRLVGANDRPWLGCVFVGLYDEQKRPVPARFARWEALRAKYGGCDELRVENGRLICPA